MAWTFFITSAGGEKQACFCKGCKHTRINKYPSCSKDPSLGRDRLTMSLGIIYSTQHLQPYGSSTESTALSGIKIQRGGSNILLDLYLGLCLEVVGRKSDSIKGFSGQVYFSSCFHVLSLVIIHDNE